MNVTPYNDFDKEDGFKKANAFSLLSIFILPYVLLSKILKLIYKPLEHAIILAAQDALSPKDSVIFQQQVSEINWIHRVFYSIDSHTTFFKVGFLTIKFRHKKMFSSKTPCISLCRVKFKVDESTIVASFIVLDNRLTFIEYNRNVEKFLSRSDIEIIDVDTKVFEVDPASP